MMSTTKRASLVKQTLKRVAAARPEMRPAVVAFLHRHSSCACGDDRLSDELEEEMRLGGELDEMMAGRQWEPHKPSTNKDYAKNVKDPGKWLGDNKGKGKCFYQTGNPADRCYVTTNGGPGGQTKPDSGKANNKKEYNKKYREQRWPGGPDRSKYAAHVAALEAGIAEMRSRMASSDEKMYAKGYRFKITFDGGKPEPLYVKDKSQAASVQKDHGKGKVTPIKKASARVAKAGDQAEQDKMWAKGYRYMIQWSSSSKMKNKDPLYVKSPDQAAKVVREDFSDEKGWKALKLTDPKAKKAYARMAALEAGIAEMRMAAVEQSLEDLKEALAMDEAFLKQALKDLKTLERGGKVENLTLANAKKNIQNVRQTIANKKKLEKLVAARSRMAASKFKEGDKIQLADGTPGEVERIKGQSAWVKTKSWSGWKELRELKPAKTAASLASAQRGFITGAEKEVWEVSWSKSRGEVTAVHKTHGPERWDTKVHSKYVIPMSEAEYNRTVKDIKRKHGRSGPKAEKAAYEAFVKMKGAKKTAGTLGKRASSKTAYGRAMVDTLVTMYRSDIKRQGNPPRKHMHYSLRKSRISDSMTLSLLKKGLVEGGNFLSNSIPHEIKLTAKGAAVAKHELDERIAANQAMLDEMGQ